MLSIITFTLHPSETQSQETKKLIGTFVPCRKRRKKKRKGIKGCVFKILQPNINGIYSRGWNTTAVDIPEK